VKDQLQEEGWDIVGATTIRVSGVLKGIWVRALEEEQAGVRDLAGAVVWDTEGAMAIIMKVVLMYLKRHCLKTRSEFLRINCLPWKTGSPKARKSDCMNLEYAARNSYGVFWHIDRKHGGG
jgi:hypothetical protein